MTTGSAVPEYDSASVPVVVTGEPDTVKMDGADKATLDTEPPAAAPTPLMKRPVALIVPAPSAPPVGAPI